MDEATPLLGHPERLKKSSNFDAMFHIVCVVAGTGLLQIPFSLAQLGWSGIPLLACFALISNYSGIILAECLYKDGERLKGYPDIARVAFGPVAELLVGFFYNSALVGTTCLYIILIGMNVTELTKTLSPKEWTIIAGLVLAVPLVFFRTLKEVAIASISAAIASILVVLLVTYQSIADYHTIGQQVTHHIFEWSAFGPIVGTLAFSYSGNFVYPEVEGSMERPQDFPKVLTWSLSLISALYLIIGVAGYLTYGDAALSPISLSLSGWTRVVSTAVVTFHVILACPVLLTTISLDVERSLGLTHEKETYTQLFSRLGLRLFLLTAIVSVSVALPFFSDVMNLIGALSNTLLIFVFPIVFHWKLFGVQRPILSVAILAIGLVGGFIGTKDAFIALYRDIMQ
ncbi:transmembrane amino acid transporter protein-domain-containing protein [Gorgonomyces haynaldii]|nr:transmembrane amino acid transporter protein-domain-containing protein [Gorgonomyces haynaldii]